MTAVKRLHAKLLEMGVTHFGITRGTKEVITAEELAEEWLKVIERLALGEFTVVNHDELDD